MKISCEIIQDLLPLYYDEVCSDDSKKTIEEHLNTCDNCSNYLKSMSSKNFEEKPTLNTEKSKINSLKTLNKELFRKKVKTVLISIFSVIVIFIIGFTLIFRLELPINYKEGLLGIEDTEDNTFKLTFLGDDFYRFHFFESDVEINGEKKHILLIHYSNTLWTKFSSKQSFISNSDGSFISNDYNNPVGFSLGFYDNIVVDKNFDYVYYLVEDYFQLMDELEDKPLDNYLEKATLLWEK